MRTTVLYSIVVFLIPVRLMDDEKMTAGRRTDDSELESLRDYVGGVITNPKPGKKTERKEGAEASSETGAKER